MAICLERDADLHMAQLMPLPLTVSCSVKSRLVLPFWYRLTCPGKRAVKRVCVCTIAMPLLLSHDLRVRLFRVVEQILSTQSVSVCVDVGCVLCRALQGG